MLQKTACFPEWATCGDTQEQTRSNRYDANSGRGNGFVHGFPAILGKNLLNFLPKSYGNSCLGM
jgi:hypothetical protein